MIQTLEKTDQPQFCALLKAESLPTADIDSINWFELIGLYMEDRLVAAAGVEDFAEHLLLRSVVDENAFCGRGIAGSLLTELHQRAKTDKRHSAWLLTTDSAAYFSKHHGYVKADREKAPESVKNSNQFSSLCPDSAVLVHREL